MSEETTLCLKAIIAFTLAYLLHFYTLWLAVLVGAYFVYVLIKIMKA